MALDLGLEGSRVLVTGGTSGLGKAAAEAFVEQGAEVVVSGVRPESEPPAGVRGVVRRDLSVPEEAAAAVADAVGALGGIDVLVHAAGGAVNGTLEETTGETWERGLALNLGSTIALTKAMLPHLSTRGRIVLFGAVSGLEPRAAHGVSNVAKAGIAAFGKTLSRELGPQGVLVNVIAPGRIRSAQLDRAYPTDEARAAYAKGAIPLGRFGIASELAPLVIYLSSPLNTYVTGQVIAVDGGMSMAT